MPDMKAVDMGTMSWECIVADGTKWRSAVKQHLKTEEDVNSETKTVTPAFFSSGTIDAATSEQEINKKTSKRIRPRIYQGITFEKVRQATNRSLKMTIWSLGSDLC